MRTKAGRRRIGLNRPLGRALLSSAFLTALLVSTGCFGLEIKRDAVTSGPAILTAEPNDPVQLQNEVLHQVPSQCRIIISLADRKLMLLENGRLLNVYPVAVGTRNTPSPEGQFTVISRVTWPTWYHKGMVVPPGTSNPLGARWIGLSLKGYGIHGTNAPNSIGHAASHGCIRMRRADLEELFRTIRPGDTVEIRRGAEAQLAHAARATGRAEPGGRPGVRNAGVGTMPPTTSSAASGAGAAMENPVPASGPAAKAAAGL